jgi:hypothetical protein
VQLANPQPRQKLACRIELFGFRKMRDVAGVDCKGRQPGECIHQIDGTVERSSDVGICVLVESDMRIADLHEERCPAFSAETSARSIASKTPLLSVKSVPAPMPRHLSAPRRDNS